MRKYLLFCNKKILKDCLQICLEFLNYCGYGYLHYVAIIFQNKNNIYEKCSDVCDNL